MQNDWTQDGARTHATQTYQQNRNTPQANEYQIPHHATREAYNAELDRLKREEEERRRQQGW